MTPARLLPGLLVALVGSGLLAPAFAQAPDSVLTLHDAVRRALASHPVVRGADAAARGADAAVGEARSRWFPHLSSSATLTRFEEPMIVFPLHGFDGPVEQIAFDQTLIQGSVSLAWTVFDGGRRGARIRGARADADAREAALDATETELIADVTRRYLAVLTARAVLAAEDEGMRALRAEEARVAQLVREGEAADVALLRVQAALAQAEAGRLDAEGALEVAALALGRTLGIDAAVPAVAMLRVSAEPPSPRAELLARVAERNPRLDEARAAAESARWARRAAVAAWFPQLEATGALQGYGSESETFTTEWQLGLRLSYPLFTGGERGNAVARAGALADAADARFRALLLDAEDALDRAQTAVGTTRARTRAVESARTHLTEVARVELLALQTGAGTEAEYLRAEADVRRVRAQLAQARAAEVTAHVELARLTGDLTPVWLDRTVEIVP